MKFSIAYPAIAMVVVFVVASQTAAQQPPAQPAETITRQLATTDVTMPADYVIGPQDVIGVIFWRETEISGDVTVRPDGRITVPMIGELPAAGLRPDELQQRILTAATRFLNDPNVAVIVRAINSRKIFVTGRVMNPGAHPLTGPLSVMQAITLAGGLTEFADEKNITLLRSEGQKSVSFKFNYRDVSRGRRLEQNIMLRPGDTVVIP